MAEGALEELQSEMKWDGMGWLRAWPAAGRLLQNSLEGPDVFHSTELGICVLLSCITFAGTTD